MIEVPALIEDPRGAVYLNPAAEQTGGGYLVPSAATLAIPARVANVPGNNFTQIESSSNAYEEVLSMYGPYSEGSTNHNRTLVSIKDGAHTERSLQNRAINLLHVFGTINNPFFLDDAWTRSLMLKPQQLYTLKFYNTGLLTTLTLDMPALESTRIFGGAVNQAKDLLQDVTLKESDAVEVYPYWFTMQNDITNRYGTPGLQLAAGDVGVAQFFNNRDDIVLVMTSILATAITSGVAGDTEAVAAYELFTAYDQQPLQDQPVAFNCGAGIGSFPHRLSCPFVIQPKDQFEVKFTNLITDATTDVFFTFFGVAIRGAHRVQARWGGF